MVHSLGGLLREKRWELGLAQADVASRAGLSLPTIRLVERTRGNITTYLRLASALGFQLRWRGLSPGVEPGRSLAERRKSLGRSQRAAAALIEVSPTTIVGMERQFIGRVDALDRLLRLLRLTPRLVPHDGDEDFSLVEVLFGDPSLSTTRTPHFIAGDAVEVLSRFPANSVDCIVTSPPYFGHRQYENGGIGSEETVSAYIANLARVTGELYRVLKPSGSFWLNLGDAYRNKHMLGVPWRVVLHLIETQGWILRNSIIWAKSGGFMDHAKDRLYNSHENLYHLVKTTEYFYAMDAIRTAPKKARIANGTVATASGISRATYASTIEASAELSETQKRAALEALDVVLGEVARGEIPDFRMIIRGKHRVTHPHGADKISYREKHLREQGFYFLRFDPRGSKLTDVWSIAPERSRGRGEVHFAVFPEALCETPILATCPEDGVVLDPFCGTGTAMRVAQKLARRSIGIDRSNAYLEVGRQRCLVTR